MISLVMSRVKNKTIINDQLKIMSYHENLLQFLVIKIDQFLLTSNALETTTNNLALWEQVLNGQDTQTTPVFFRK